MKTSFWIAPLLLALLSGCSSPEGSAGDASGPATAAEAAAAKADRVVAWNCGDDTPLVTEFFDTTDTVLVQHPAGTVELPHVEAASGARFSDGSVTFWTKGEEAIYETVDGETLDCTVDRYRTALESARLAGYQFRAVGNEPGWMLLIGPDQTVWETDYGETRYEIATPEPVSPNDTSTVWQTEVDGKLWTLTLSEGPCFDDMSGAQFYTKVQIDFDDRTYRGCGQPLR